MRIIGGWIRGGLLAAAVSLQVTAFAAESNTKCVPRAEMQILAQNFKQFQNLASSDYCYDGSPTSVMIESLEFMRGMHYADPMTKSHDELFSGAFADDWYDYFIRRINLMVVESDCPTGAGAYVKFGRPVMHFCPMIMTDSFSSVDRISAMMHEARHIDGYDHIRCTRGARAGVPGACDDKISTQGSYAVTVETYAQLAAYAIDLHPALKAYARASALTFAIEAFETPVQVDFTPQFLLMTTGKELYKLAADGSSRVERAGSSPALGHIVMRSNHMVLFPDEKTQPSSYLFAGNAGTIAQAAGDLAAEYNAQSAQQRGELIDMHISWQWSARVFRDHVLFQCELGDTNPHSVGLDDRVPTSLIYPEGYDRAFPTAHLALESGEVVELGCRNGSGFIRPSSVTLDQKFKRLYKSGDEVVGLRADGRLFQVRGTQSSPLQTSVDGRVHELAPSARYSFFEAAGARP